MHVTTQGSIGGPLSGRSMASSRGSVHVPQRPANERSPSGPPIDRSTAACNDIGRQARRGPAVTDLDIGRAWLVDPAAGREGPGEIVVRDGILESVTWLDGADADGIDASGVVVAPGSSTCTPICASPATRTPRRWRPAWPLRPTAASRRSARCRTRHPTLDEPGVLSRIRAAAAASGSPVELLAHGAVTVGRAGETLAALGELADAGVVGFSDDGAPVRSASILRNALAYAGALGLPVVDHPEDATQTDGAEANDGFVATVLGLRGWPAAAEEAAVARDLAILADVIRDVPGARLHLTHVSTAGSLELIRRAKAAGLPVTCDVTPHHLALTDEWVAGARRYAWEAGRDGDPWRDEVRVARRSPRPSGSTRRSGPRPTPWPAWLRWPTARSMRSPRTTRPTPRSTRRSSSAGPRTGSAASRPRWGSSWRPSMRDT